MWKQCHFNIDVATLRLSHITLKVLPFIPFLNSIFFKVHTNCSAAMKAEIWSMLIPITSSLSRLFCYLKFSSLWGTSVCLVNTSLKEFSFLYWIWSCRLSNICNSLYTMNVNQSIWQIYPNTSLYSYLLNHWKFGTDVSIPIQILHTSLCLL